MSTIAHGTVGVVWSPSSMVVSVLDKEPASASSSCPGAGVPGAATSLVPVGPGPSVKNAVSRQKPRITESPVTFL